MKTEMEMNIDKMKTEMKMSSGTERDGHECGQVEKRN